MSENVIEHVIKKKTEYVYGYLIWDEADKEKYRRVFPDGEFDLIFDNKLVPGRRVDWKRNRLCLYPVKDLITKGKTLIISRKGDKIIIKSKDK